MTPITLSKMAMRRSLLGRQGPRARIMVLFFFCRLIFARPGKN
jgi:hypothetical protein